MELGIDVQRVQVLRYLRFLVPKTIPFMVVGIRNLKYWVVRPSGTLVLTRFLIRHYNILPKKELHGNLQVQELGLQR